LACTPPPPHHPPLLLPRRHAATRPARVAPRARVTPRRHELDRDLVILTRRRRFKRVVPRPPPPRTTAVFAFAHTSVLLKKLPVAFAPPPLPRRRPALPRGRRLPPRRVPLVGSRVLPRSVVHFCARLIQTCVRVLVVAALQSEILPFTTFHPVIFFCLYFFPVKFSQSLSPAKRKWRKKESNDVVSKNTCKIP
jgi:hypothetical protein